MLILAHMTSVLESTDFLLLFLAFCIGVSFARLRVGNMVADRDIVQFVPFRQFAHVSFY